MNSSNSITISAARNPEMLNGITENILLFFPLFFRNILRITQGQTGTNLINMQLRMMLMLIHNGMMQPSEIGIRMGISKPNVTALIDKLITQGYVQRKRDEKDRRVIHIVMTARGRKFVDNRLKLVRNNIKNNLSLLSHDELDSLHLALNTFRTIVSKMESN